MAPQAESLRRHFFVVLRGLSGSAGQVVGDRPAAVDCNCIVDGCHWASIDDSHCTESFRALDFSTVDIRAGQLQKM